MLRLRGDFTHPPFTNGVLGGEMPDGAVRLDADRHRVDLDEFVWPSAVEGFGPKRPCFDRGGGFSRTKAKGAEHEREGRCGRHMRLHSQLS